MRRDADQDLITYMPLHGVLDMAVRPGRKECGAGSYPWGVVSARITRARRG